MLLFLNELSCGTPQVAGRVDEIMEDFVALLRVVKQFRPEAALISPVKREDLELAQGYYVNQWIGARPRNHDLWQFIRRMQNRAPYSTVLPAGAAEETECWVNDEKADGLAAAHIMDGLLVSFLADPAWDTSWVNATCDEFDQEADDVVSGLIEVRHAASADHVQPHERWIRHAGTSAFRLGAEIWKARADLYPHLEFLPRVEHDLRDLIPEWVTPVANRLASLNEALEEWDPRSSHELVWKTEVTPESQTRQGLCWFSDLDGEQRLFALHARFRPHQGRIHLRLVPEKSTARIAYIGLKLGLKGPGKGGR
jgi:hypothetical protein